MSKTALTAETLRLQLLYVPETGHFFWRQNIGRAKIGTRAGCLYPSQGRWKIRLFGRRYYASNLAWLYMTGEWPSLLVDHRDTNKLNDAWGNLRLATCSQNFANVGKTVRNTTGFKGVSLTGSRFRADIKFKGKTEVLGVFETAEAAHAAYCKRAKELYGDFFNPG